jgi:hypothetical protein
MANRDALISQMKAEHPLIVDNVIELLVDVWMKNPDWIKGEARRLQREDKAVKKASAAPREVKQAVFPCVVVEEPVVVADDDVADHDNNLTQVVVE